MEKKFGDRLLEIRNGLGLTQDAIAELMDIPKRTYQGLEYNQAKPTLDTISKICSGLKITPNELLGFAALPKTNEVDQIIELLRLWEKAPASRRETIMKLLRGPEKAEAKEKA